MSMKGPLVGVLFTWLAAAAGPAGAQELTPGAIVGSYGREGNTITIRTEAASVRLEFCTPSMVRVRTSFSGRFADDESVMRLSPAEQFFGLGERMDRFNWRGHSAPCGWAARQRVALNRMPWRPIGAARRGPTIPARVSSS